MWRIEEILFKGKLSQWADRKILTDWDRQKRITRNFVFVATVVIAMQQSICLTYSSFSLVGIFWDKVSIYLTNALLIGSIACILIEEYRALKGKTFCLGMMTIPLAAVYSCSVYLEFAAGVEKEYLIFQTMSLPYVLVTALTIVIYQMVGREKK